MSWSIAAGNDRLSHEKLHRDFLAILLVIIPLINAFGQETVFAGEDRPWDRVYSLNIGPNAKNWGYAGVTCDFLANDRLSIFVTGGFGTFLIGGGAAYYTNSIYEDSGVFSAAAYQWKIAERGFLTAGVSYGMYFIQYQGFLPVLSYEKRF